MEVWVIRLVAWAVIGIIIGFVMQQVGRYIP